ncbi:UDP-N-acetylglucosamine 2-epimerase (non-hydrolyzing) [Clostridiaceae bacterium]|nr:UDP-N-acetylglucosamine 2-epimerase (non-hydrolyzing) [Clostridiaceae bacterium]RKI16904.1 UDP-N-acetylglucosamine 2-epimerase (non-hydrolyzing) [bacterium 1XD21-70]
MKKILVVFGTRPEAIKMCPLVKQLKKEKCFQTIVCVTGQHREMLKQVLDAFSIFPDYDLKIMQTGQTLYEITEGVLKGMNGVLNMEQPDLVLVHGDTTTSFVSALSAFYQHIPVGHVEAGLRTYNLEAPYPEEFNRQCVGILAEYHFAPTIAAKDNLIKEGKMRDKVYVTGNTVIDALQTTVVPNYHHDILDWAADSRLIILTAHRRENLGKPLYDIFYGIKNVLNEIEDIKIIYPIHPNPRVREAAYEVFGSHERIRIVDPLDVLDFHNIMSRSYLILTDSGGIQEEAPALGKPVLVLRNTTERPEGVTAGTLKLVGTKTDVIAEELKRLLMDNTCYQQMSKAINPYGDGKACEKIVKILKNEFVE